MKYAEMAVSAMPTCPESDHLYQCIQFGQSELDQLVGITYTYLAGHFPDSDYAQLAYNIFEQSMHKQAMNQGYLGGSLIRRADAARALGDMYGFVEDMTEGFHIGDEIESLRLLILANNVMGEIPPEWKQEKSVQNLQKAITHAIVARR
jgi:hypothetical protein